MIKKFNIFLFFLAAGILAGMAILSGCTLAIPGTPRGLPEVPVGAVDVPLGRGLPAQERLIYRVTWLGITAGEITAQIKGGVEWHGRPCYQIEVRARTSGLMSSLYRVDDFFRSYLDVAGFYPLRHEELRHEGGYRKDAVTDFDQASGKAHFYNAVDKSTKTFDIPSGVQDILTAAYLGRFLPLSGGRMFHVKVCNSEKVYDLYIAACGRSVVAGRHTFRLIPFVKINGKDIREGRGSGHVTDDDLRRPIRVVIKGPVFTQVTAVLVSPAL